MTKFGFIFTLLIFLFNIKVNGQTFDYSYKDPCTGTTKIIQVPSNGITVTYYNQIKTFNPADFYNGGFERWSQSIYQNFGNNNPCSQIIGIPGAINIGQQTTLTFFSIITSIASALDVRESMSGKTDLLSTSINSVEKSDSKKNSNNSQNNNGSNTNSPSDKINTSGSNTNQSNSSTVQSGSNNSSNTNGSSSQSNTTGTNNSQPVNTGYSNQSGTNSNGQSNKTTSEKNNQSSTNNTTNTEQSKSTSSGVPNGTNQNKQDNNTNSNTQVINDQQQPTTTKKTDLLGSTVSSLGNMSSSNKNGNKPIIVGGGDFIGFNFFNSDITFGGKFTGSYTSMKWDGTSVKGLIADYTSAIRGPNVAAFYAKIHKKRIDLISTSLTLGFDTKFSLYGTIAIGQMWTIKKNLKAVYLATASFGNIYEERFLGTAAIAGGMYDLKINKRFSAKLMCLYVYAPYVSYYNDLVLKSPHVVLPIVGTNINLTKTFKFNINAGGAWAVKENTLNYTVVMGTRFIL